MAQSKLPVITQVGLALDIDETLSYTARQWMQEMLDEFGNPENLTAEQAIAKYRYTQHVPYWQSGDALQEIQRKRHCNELQTRFAVIDGAQEFVAKIHEIIPIVAYVSARPASIAKGTKIWLEKHGFPKVPLVLRPLEVSKQDEHKWKASVLQKLYPTVVGIIDDNASILPFLSAYKGKVFLFDVKEVPVDCETIDVVACHKWEHVYEEVKKEYL